MNILLDSSVLIDVIKKKLYLGNDRYFINPVVFSEVLYGLLYVGKSEKQFHAFLEENGVEILTISASTASIHAKLKLKLNKKGSPLADNDLLVAASCLEHALVLYTLNLKHFTRIPELKLFKAKI